MRIFPRLRSALFLFAAFIALVSIPTTAYAQRRPPRRSGGVGVFIAGPYRYPPVYFYDDWYDGSYQYPYGPYPPYGQYRMQMRDELTSSIRLEVKPRTAEVFVDGYRAGIVDDFDGIFQRLHVRPGEHELVLYLDGYRTVRQALSVVPYSDQKIQYMMQPLGPGERAEPRPQPAPRPAPQQPRILPTPQDRPYPPGTVIPPDQPAPPPVPQDRQLPPPPMPPDQGPPPSPGAPRSNFGTLSIRTQPADAEIIIDGERWMTPAGQDRLVLQLSEGKHRVEIRKQGYETFSTEIDVHRGETNPLNVSLLRAVAAAK